MFPATFWKKLVFCKYKSGSQIGRWVMTKENRKIMSARIANITPVHGMKKLRDPSMTHMKGIYFLNTSCSSFLSFFLSFFLFSICDLYFCVNLADEWVDWMITTSVVAVDGLLDPVILNIWKKCREGIMIHIQTEVLTPENRAKAKVLLYEAGQEMEEARFIFRTTQ